MYWDEKAGVHTAYRGKSSESHCRVSKKVQWLLPNRQFPRQGINRKFANVETTIRITFVTIVILECFDNASISPLTPVARSNNLPNPTIITNVCTSWYSSERKTQQQIKIDPHNQENKAANN
jgi:hypothetical protein